MFLEKKKTLKKVLFVFLLIFAVIGLVFVLVFFAMQFGWLNVKGSVSERNSYFNINNSLNLKNDANSGVVAPWVETPEWKLLKEVFTRDQAIITKAGEDAKISPRLILSGVMGEQIRFFNGRRESFKNYFEPLKILAQLSKFSFGIAGLKPDTVKLIEEHLKDPRSRFYLGSDMENVANYPEGVDLDIERMNRITDVKNPYYSYLYVGLFMQQVEAQWERAGYPVTNRPEILATLYNLGFNRSIPKANSAAGGATINLGGTDYTFGDFAYEFYYSNELVDIFPKE